MAYSPTSYINAQPITETSAVQKQPLGTVMTANDPLYGEGEFIYLKGLASTAAGDLVVYDLKASTTTRTVAATRGPAAIAMSANVANQYGWYCIRGIVPVLCNAAAAVNVALFTTAAAGAVDDAVVAGSGVSGLTLATAAGAGGLADAIVFYPNCNGLA